MKQLIENQLKQKENLHFTVLLIMAFNRKRTPKLHKNLNYS
jgi:hypothetical protein